MVTGASAGVGRAVAGEFARRGFDVAVLARGAAGLRAAADDVAATGARALPVPVDVADADEVDAAAGKVEDELGPIDVWVNDAMTTVFAPTWDDRPRRLPAGHRGDVPRSGVGDEGGARSDAAARSRQHRQRRVGLGVHRHPAPVGLLRGPSLPAAVLRVGTGRADPRDSRVHLCMVHLPAVNTPQFDWCETTLDRHPQPVPPIYQPEIPARYIVDTALSGRRSTIVGSWNKLLVAAGSVLPGFGNQFAGLSAWESHSGTSRCRPIGR